MVRSLATFAAGLLLATASVRAELQLTPSIYEYELDGVKLKELAFADGENRVLYQAPRGWDYTGSATQLVLHPPQKTQAEALVTNVPVAAEQTFDDETVKKLSDEALTLLPKGNTNAVIVSQEKNPLRIGNRETFLLTMKYNFFGQPCFRSILFVNRGKEQLRCQLTCREADSSELQKAFMASQYTWQHL